MSSIALGLTLLSLIIWVVLVGFWGQFWRCDQVLPIAPPLPEEDTRLPTVAIVIPARNEADVIGVALDSLLHQDYPGPFTIFLVDDHSTDGTADIAQATATAAGKATQLKIISAQPLPVGWTGKLWAMDQGTHQASTHQPDYFLLTDADIRHSPTNLRQLVAKAEAETLDLTSLMVRLRCQSFWEKLLIPAFVFFFQKLYPFPWVNNPQNPMAAAAGGCILIRRAALERIGGIQSLRQALIDDCTLAKLAKQPGHPIWLGLTPSTDSLRPYPSLESIWNMVARTAYTQLNYSPLLLVGTLIGMTLIYLLPPMAALLGALTGQWLIATIGLTAYLLMTLSYWPTIRFYQCPVWYAFSLPVIGLLYTLMTFDSALRHWQGKGGAWKGRVYG